jgi:tRNA pseudouridine38-40 synthase
VRALKIVVAYDGTPFVGWQRQAEGVSIQGLLEDALARIEGRAVGIVGAGRTDAGVHAFAQVASFTLEHSIPVSDLRRALNAMLPREVRVTRVEEVAEGFHARYSARAKTYRYLLVNGDTISPFLARYAWHVDLPLSLEAMGEAARLLEGTHDFGVFQSAGSSVKTTTRTIFSSLVTDATHAGLSRTNEPGDVASGFSRTNGPGDVASGLSRILTAGAPGSRLLVYDVRADGFLRHMVRAIVGSLVEVGAGRREPAWFTELLAAGSRAAAGPTAPAQGLWLTDVEY